MYWTRAKWILIVLFFCINVFLLTYMLTTTEEQVTVSKETVQNTLEILKSHSINVQEDLIPTKLNPMPVLYLKQREKKPDYSQWMGLSWQRTEEQNEVVYQSGAKKLVVRDNGFIYDDISPEGNFDMKTPQVPFDIVTKWLQKDILQGVYNGAKYSFPLPDEKFAVVVHQKYGDREIVGQELKVFLSAKGIEKMEGGLLVPYKVSVEKYPLRHVTGVLIDFVENKDRPERITTVQAIHLGYYTAQNAHTDGVRDTSAVPAWIIVTTDGEYVYDATNGKYITKIP